MMEGGGESCCLVLGLGSWSNHWALWINLSKDLPYERRNSSMDYH